MIGYADLAAARVGGLARLQGTRRETIGKNAVVTRNVARDVQALAFVNVLVGGGNSNGADDESGNENEDSLELHVE